MHWLWKETHLNSTTLSPPTQPPGLLRKLANILFALERTALALTDEQKPEDAAFYRGIGRALADAYGRQKLAPPPR